MAELVHNDAGHRKLTTAPSPTPATSRADLGGVLRAIVAELADPKLSATSRALTVDMQDDPDLAGGMVDRLLGPQPPAIADRLRAAQAVGGLREDLDLAVAGEMLVGPLYYRRLLRTAPLTETYADTLTDMALR